MIKKYWLRGSLFALGLTILSLLLAFVLIGVYLPIDGAQGLTGVQTVAFVPAMPGILVISLGTFLNSMTGLPNIVGIVLGLALSFAIGAFIGYVCSWRR